MQSLAAEAPVRDMYVPEGHEIPTDTPSGQYASAVQVSHAVNAEDGPNFPAGQLLQEMPSVPYVPLKHLVHIPFKR